MEAILFPRTHLSSAQLNLILTCFKTLHLLRPSAGTLPDHLGAAASSGRLVVHLPPESDAFSMTHLKDAFRSWVMDHGGVDLHHLSIEGDSPPFFEETATAQIRQEIERAVGSVPSEDTSPSLLDQARLLLEIAQDFDEETDEIAGTLDRVARTEAVMMADMLGQSAEDNIITGPQTNQQLSRGGERMRAWAHVAATLEGLPEVWVLVDGSLVDEIANHFDGLTPQAPAIDIPGGDPVAADRFADWLAEVLACDTPGDALAELGEDDPVQKEAAGRLTLYKAPDHFGPRLTGNRCAFGGGSWLVLIEAK